MTNNFIEKKPLTSGRKHDKSHKALGLRLKLTASAEDEERTRKALSKYTSL